MRLPALAVLLIVAACGDDIDPVDASLPDAATSADGALSADARPDDATPDDATPDDATPDDAAPDDAAVDAAPDDASVDAAPDDATVDATVDAAPIDADITSPVITGVATSDGSTQVRQFSTVTLVITGDRLAAATSVVVGAITAPIVTRADTELTVTLAVPHGHAAGPLGVTVTTPDGVVTAPAAVTITHFIVAPTAAPGGRGTYDSPITLCDTVLATGTAGDTFELLAGTHTCNEDHGWTNGFRMIGAGAAQTTVDMISRELLVGTGPTEIANLTLRRGTLTTFGEPPPFTFHDMIAETKPFHADRDGSVRFERVTVTGAELATVEGFGSITAIDVEVTGPVSGVGTAVELDQGTATLTRVAIRRFAIGVALTEPARFGGCNHRVTLTDSDIVDATIGIQVLCGTATLVRSSIVDDPLAAPVATIGVDIDKGGLTMRESSRIEVATHAVQTSRADCGESEHNSFVDATDAVIIGGSTGIDHQACEVGGVTLRRSLVRGGTMAVRAACGRDGRDCHYDLSGGNDLQVTSPTGHALIEARTEFDEFAMPTNMVGSTLNGRSYAGQLIVGPAQMTPDYWIVSNGVIQF